MIEPAHHGRQIFGAQALLLHAKLDRFYRVRQVHRVVQGLISLRQRASTSSRLLGGQERKTTWNASFIT
jgi:hypothetical protein